MFCFFKITERFSLEFSLLRIELLSLFGRYAGQTNIIFKSLDGVGPIFVTLASFVKFFFEFPVH